MYEEGLKKTGRNIVLAIFAIIVGILTFLSMFLNTYISNIKDDNLCSTYYASMNEILSDKVLLDLIRQDLNNLRSNNLIDVIVYPNFINIDGKIKYIK